MKKVSVIINIVISNKKELIGVRDLLKSASMYLSSSKIPIIISDNTGDEKTYCKLQRCTRYYNHCIFLKGERIFRNRISHSPSGRLYYRVSQCMKYALEHFEFRSFIEMDPDSLIVGFNFDKDVTDYFKKFPNAGLIGSYKYDCNYKPRDVSPWVPYFKREREIWEHFLKHLDGSDYILGENVLSAVAIYSYECIATLNKLGLLENELIKKSIIAEDVIFSTLVRFAGFQIHSFVDEGYPLALAWKGLPMSISNIRRKNKKVIHSVKFTVKDRLIRNIFKLYRIYDKITGSKRDNRR